MSETTTTQQHTTHCPECGTAYTGAPGTPFRCVGALGEPHDAAYFGIATAGDIFPAEDLAAVAPQLHDATEDPAPAPVATQPPSKYLMSLTGFDEIAIAMHFGQKVTALRQEDAVTLGRALAFVHYRRNDGDNDKEAHRRAMELSMQAVVDFFPREAQRDDDETAPEGKTIEDVYAEQAVAVVRIGVAPSEWKALSASERAAIIHEHNYCASERSH